MRSAFIRAVFFIVCSFGSTFLPAQPGADADRDSLLTVIKTTTDSTRLKAMSHLYRYYFNRGEFRNSLTYCKRALQLANDLNDLKKVPRITYGIGLNYTQLIKYDSARFYLEETENLLKGITDPLLRIQCYHAQGILRSYQSDFDGASEFFIACANYLETEEAKEFRHLLPQTYCHLGYNLINENQVEKGIEYELKALPFRNYQDEQRYRILIFLNLSDGYVKLKKLDEAKIYLDSAKRLKRTLINQPVEAMVAMSEGYYYQSLADLPKAIESYTHAFVLCDSVGNSYLKAEAGNDLAELFLKQKKYAEAEKFALESNAIAKTLKQYKIASGTYEVLKILATRKGN